MFSQQLIHKKVRIAVVRHEGQKLASHQISVGVLSSAHNANTFSGTDRQKQELYPLKNHKFTPLLSYHHLSRATEAAAMMQGSPLLDKKSSINRMLSSESLKLNQTLFFVCFYKIHFVSVHVSMYLST